MARPSPSAPAQTTTTTDGSGNVTIGIGTGSTATVQTVLTAIDGITGAAHGSTVTGPAQLVLSTGTAQNLVIAGGTGTALAALGLTAGTTNVTPPALTGQTLDDRCHRRRHRDEHHLRHRRRPDLDPQRAQYGVGGERPAGQHRLHRRDHHHDHQQRGVVDDRRDHRQAPATPFASLTAAAPVADPNSQATRASLVAQYNKVLQQINTTAQDSSFNGINLLNGDTLNLTFDETGASKLSISGVTFNDAGLGLSSLTVGHRLPGQQLGQQAC